MENEPAESAVASIALAPLRWVERARGWRRLALLALYGLAALAIGAVLWRRAQLAGLPDPGEPPDPVASRDHVPDDRNAFVPYRAAAGLYREMTDPECTSFGRANLDWSLADPTLRGWVAANAGAVRLLCEGADRPGASLDLPETSARLEVLRRLSWIGDAALFEAGRLRSEGDRAGAWALLRAVVRASRDMQRPVPTLQGRSHGIILAQFAREPVAAWAADPGVEPGLLRRALDDLAAARDLGVPSETDFYRLGYRASRADLESLPSSWLRAEPERSRRVLGLLAANDLAWADRPLADRPGFAVPRLRIYQDDPGTPPDARRLPPEELARWVDSAAIGPQLAWRLEDRPLWDRADRWTIAEMLGSVAVPLFTREAGRPPATPAEALRRYLPTPGDEPGRDESEPLPGPAPPTSRVIPDSPFRGRIAMPLSGRIVVVLGGMFLAAIGLNAFPGRGAAPGLRVRPASAPFLGAGALIAGIGIFGYRSRKRAAEPAPQPDDLPGDLECSRVGLTGRRIRVVASPEAGTIRFEHCHVPRKFLTRAEAEYTCPLVGLRSVSEQNTRNGSYLLVVTGRGKAEVASQSQGYEALRAFLGSLGLPRVGGPEIDNPRMALIYVLGPMGGLLLGWWVTPNTAATPDLLGHLIAGAAVGVGLPMALVVAADRWLGLRLALPIGLALVGAAVAAFLANGMGGAGVTATAVGALPGAAMGFVAGFAIARGRGELASDPRP